jgi:hypothetical protein
MSNGRAHARDSVGLLWLLAVAGTGLAIWAACTDCGAISYRTCAAAPVAVPARPAPPARLGPRSLARTSTSLKAQVSGDDGRGSPWSSTSRIDVACSG